MWTLFLRDSVYDFVRSFFQPDLEGTEEKAGGEALDDFDEIRQVGPSATENRPPDVCVAWQPPKRVGRLHGKP